MYTKDEFEEMMNESYPQVEVGSLQYGRGTVLRKVDPVQFDIEYNDWVQYMEECEEDRVN